MEIQDEERYISSIDHIWSPNWDELSSFTGSLVNVYTAEIIKEIKWDIKQRQENRIKNFTIGNPLLELIARLEKEEESNIQEDGGKVV